MSERLEPSTAASPETTTAGNSAVGYWLSLTWIGLTALQTYLAISVAPLAATCASLLPVRFELVALGATAVAVAVVALSFVRSQSGHRISRPAIASLGVQLFLFVIASGTGGIIVMLTQSNAATFNGTSLLGLGVGIPSGYSVALLLVCCFSARREQAANWRPWKVGLLMTAGALALAAAYGLATLLLCSAP